MGPREPRPETIAAVTCLHRAARSLELEVDALAAHRFAVYIDTLLLWRSRLSLTGATTAISVVRDHILDSLQVCSLLKPGMRLADLGSGAGFPGVPLAILCLQSGVTLVESRRKRANFLKEVVRQMALTNVTVVEERAESFARSTPHEYGMVTSRALGPLSDFLPIARLLLEPGGIAVAMKGPRGADELHTRIDGFTGPRIVQYQLDDGRQRMLLVFRSAA